MDSRGFVRFTVLAVFILSASVCVFPAGGMSPHPSVVMDSTGMYFHAYSANPVIDGNFISPSVLHDPSDGLYKMWFTGTGWTVWYATSHDGLHWTMLSTNPIISGGERMFGPSVVKVGGSYVMYFSQSNSDPGVQGEYVIRRATSADGVHWTVQAGNVLTGTPGEWDESDAVYCSVIFDGTVFRLYYTGASPAVYSAIGLATSTDGITFTKSPSNPVLGGSGDGWDASFATGPGAFMMDGKFYLFYSGDTHPDCCSYSMGLASSEDGIHWSRSSSPIHPRGGWGWESGANGGATCIPESGKVKIWYHGLNQYSGNWTIGYATLDDNPLNYDERYTVDDHTVALWRFNDGTGSIAHDETQNHLDLTLTDVSWVPGPFGAAGRFNGHSSMAKREMTDKLRMHGQYTIECWINPDTLYFGDDNVSGGVGASIVSSLGRYPSGGGYELTLFNDGVQSDYRVGDPISELSRRAALPSAHRAYNLKTTYQSIDLENGPLTVVKVWIDSMLVDSAVHRDVIQYDNTPNFYIGTNLDGFAAGSKWTREFPGIIDEVRISDIARTVPIHVTPDMSLPKVEMRFTGGDGSAAVLGFGAWAGATEGLDAALGEMELPPLAPAGNFDVRWTIAGTNGSALNFQDTLSSARTSNLYRGLVQLPDAHPFVSVTWNSATLPPGTFILRDRPTHGDEYQLNMKAENSFTFTDSVSLTFEIIYTADPTFTTSVGARWNMLSIPIVPEDPSQNKIFTGAISKPFKYGFGYEAADSLEVGVGYWVKYPIARTIGIHGTAVTEDTIHLHKGWNLIGSIAVPVSAGNVQTIPPNSLTSPFFGYDGYYFLASTLRPAVAYWVKAATDCYLILGGSALPGVADASVPDRFAAPQDAVRLIVRDADGMQASELYVLRNGTPGLRMLDAPPPAPAGSADARFAGDMFTAAVDRMTSPVALRLTGMKYPVTVSWKSDAAGFNPMLVNGASGKAIAELTGEGSVTIEQTTAAGLAIAGSVKEVAPSQFRLEQNYPNPFNPSTRIEFTIPADGRARLVLYNAAGQEVTVLVDQDLRAGLHDVVWDGSSQPSGVYWYQLNAGGETLVRSMLLLK